MAATTYNSAYDQLSSSVAENFLDYIDDNVFVTNMVFQRGWEEAEEVDAGRFLAVNILSGKNANAMNFGQYDIVMTNPQTIISTATYPWSFYVVSVIMDYQTLRINQKNKNLRADQVSAQLEDAVASLADLCGYDLTSNTKQAGGPTGQPALGIVEATDNGTITNSYGNILRTGAGSFSNWKGYVNAQLTSGNIGTAANDAPLSKFYDVYTQCQQGSQAPTDIFSTKQGLAAYAFAMQSQQRFGSMDEANAGFAGIKLFSAMMWADDHIPQVVNGSSFGANYYYINKRKTKFFYFAKKGFDFIDWVDAPNGMVAKQSRYATCFQYASSQPRTGGQLQNVNSIQNL